MDWFQKTLGSCELYLMWKKKRKDYSFTLLAKMIPKIRHVSKIKFQSFSSVMGMARVYEVFVYLASEGKVKILEIIG